MALIGFSTGKKDRKKLFELLSKNVNVNSLYKVNNGWDFMVEVIFPGVKEVEDFIESIEEQAKVRNKKLLYVIAEIKKEEFLANPKTTQLIWGIR